MTKTVCSHKCVHYFPKMYKAVHMHGSIMIALQVVGNKTGVYRFILEDITIDLRFGLGGNSNNVHSASFLGPKGA